MGSYACCWLGDFHVGDSKNALDPSLISLFRSTDKIVTKEINDLPPGLRRHYKDPEHPYYEPEEPFVYYAVPIAVVRDRLDLMGYTLDSAKSAFEDCIRREIQRFQDYEAEDAKGRWKDEITELEKVTPQSWIDALRQIRAQGLTDYSHEEWMRNRGTLLAWMLPFSSQEEWYGYPGMDKKIPLRLALEACADADELIYDITELVGEYLGAGDDHVQDIIDSYEVPFPPLGRVIVLTEGKFDAWVLSESLELLYPHLRDYYSFMDFEAFRVGGGTGALANMVKAFAGAGIINRTLALFDNDAAGADALRTIPEFGKKNLCVLQLPPIDELTDYPTLGPTGLSNMDVNGLAGSIELYLGYDVLRAPDTGELHPIQWTGFVSGINKYQGELMRKGEVQERFRAKLRACKENRTLIEHGDWNGLRSILHSLRTAFHQADLEQMLDHLRLEYEPPAGTG